MENRISIIELLNGGLCSSKQASQALEVSQRQAQRLLKRFKENDFNLSTLLPKKRNNWNKKSDQLRDLIISLKKENPKRSNYCISDILKQNNDTNLSACPATVRKILIDNNCYSIKETERRSFKMFEAKKAGQIIQMDTTEGCWLKGYKKIKLILCLDDYSRAILSFKWVEKDTTWNNMLVLREIIEKYGIPRMIYTDNDSKFRTIRHGSIYFKYHKDEYQTEIHRSLKQLGVALINHPPYHAFCKGKVERLFRFIQNRFLPEMKANNLEELNQEFSKWVEWYNANHINRMTRSIPKERLKHHCFKPLSGSEDLDWIFSLKEMRRIDKYNSFSFNGIRYFLKKQDCLVGERLELALNPTHKIRVYSDNKFIQEFKIKNK
jgi:putative transposase